MNLCEHLTIPARLFPEKEAIHFEGQSFTYAQLDQLSIQAAGRLTQAGVQPGQRVAILLPNVPAFVVWYFAALRVGAIVVSISTRLSEKEVAFVLSDCEARVLVTAQDKLADFSASLPDCIRQVFGVSDGGDLCDHDLLSAEPIQPSAWFDAGPHDAALILYTSGTTGFAKGATLSHMNVRSNVHAFNHLCEMQPEDRILLAVPLFHCFGQNALLNSAFNVGATIILQRGFDMNESKQLIAEQRVTQLYGVPTMFQLFYESCEPQDLSSIRYCFSAAAMLPEQVSRRWHDKFAQPIYEGYGLTETSPFASYNHRLKYVAGSIGTPIDAVEMKIVNSETGESCPPGELGEIAIRGPNVMLGYWNRPEETARAIRNHWFHSGDIGRQDESGFFYMVDRVKDMVSVGGLKVYPAEVERVLLEHESVSQVAVVGFPEKIFGEQVVAFVVLPEKAVSSSEQFRLELRQHCQDNLANYKVPKRFIAIEALPRNPSGKILKTKLREYDLSQSVEYVENPSHPSAATRAPTLWLDLQQSYPVNRLEVATAFVQGLVQTLNDGDDQPAPDARFLEIGLDSLMIVEMSTQIQAEVGPERLIPATLVFDYPTVRDLAKFLVSTFEPADTKSTATSNLAAPTNSATVSDSSSIRQQVETMTEEEALGELIRELGSTSQERLHRKTV